MPDGLIAFQYVHALPAQVSGSYHPSIMTTAAIDPIKFEVIRNALTQAAEEMAITFILNRPRSNVGSVFYLGSDLSGRRK